MITNDVLNSLASSYLAFLNKAGERDKEEKIPDFFASNFKKIVNGETKVQSSMELGPYLWQARQNYGKWRVAEGSTELFPSASSSVVTVRYTVETKGKESIKLIVIAILKVNAVSQIEEVNEVDHTL